MKSGVVDAGGGFRGIYACGVMDRCLDDGINFDLGIGVSAGSANLSSFSSKQTGRNYRFYTVYGMRPQYAGIRNFIFKRTFIDMDYIYSTLSNEGGEDPLDFDALMENPIELYVVAADAQTGEVKYFTKADMSRNNYGIMKASCAIPGICKPYNVGGRMYFDGALGDPIPVEKAVELGCNKTVVILTRPVDQPRQSDSDMKLAKIVGRKYPKAAEKLCLRAQMYNDSVQYALRLQDEGRALVVAPDYTCGVSTLTRDKQKLDALYAKGYADGGAIAAFMEL